jgi:hypothetical protein
MKQATVYKWWVPLDKQGKLNVIVANHREFKRSSQDFNTVRQCIAFAREHGARLTLAEPCGKPFTKHELALLSAQPAVGTSEQEQGQE